MEKQKSFFRLFLNPKKIREILISKSLFLFLILLIIFAGFWFFKNENQPLRIGENVLAQSCSNECAVSGSKSCETGYVLKTCGNYDADSCLEWKYELCQYGCDPFLNSCNLVPPSCSYFYNNCSQSILGQTRCNSNNINMLEICGGNFTCYWLSAYDCSYRSARASCGTEGCSADKKPVWQCNPNASPGGDPCRVSYCVADSSDPSCCISECSAGQTRCVGNTRQICGNYDSDYCLEWGDSLCGSTACGYGTCQDNEKPVWGCVNGNCVYTCQRDEIACGKDECPAAGTTQCLDSITKQTCGQYDADPYLDWKTETCTGDTSCGYGTCADNQKPVWGCSNGACNYTCVNDLNCCTNECSQQGQTQCKDSNTKQTCGNWDVDACLEWSAGESCVTNSSCGFGKCQDNEKPIWKCAGSGICDYDCVSDSSCQIARNCTDDCSSAGESQCADSASFKTCGYYDTDVCLDWSLPKICSGPETCGYGNCQDNQKPQWGCSNGRCDYTCVEDSKCSPSPSPSPSPTCQDECSQRGQTRCFNENSIQTCDSNFDADPCLEWGPATLCQGETECGSQGCQKNQRPSWSCSNNQCAFKCVEDVNCVQGSAEIICGDFICDQGENVSCPQDCEKPSLSISVLAKEEKAKDWKEEVSFKAGEKFDVRLLVKNNSQRDFSGVTVRAEIPQEIIYERNLKIDDQDSRSDIRYGLDLGFFPANTEKSITFKVSASSKIKTKTELEIKGVVEAENLTASAGSKIIIEKPSGGAKWYWWLLALLIIGGIVFAFLVLKRRAEERELISLE